MVPAARPVCSATSLMASPFTMCGKGSTRVSSRRIRPRGPPGSPPWRNGAAGCADLRGMTRFREREIDNAIISEPQDHTVMDGSGAVRSIQAANVMMPEGELPALWTPAYLERLARTYWKFLSRVSLGLIRVE